MKKNILCFILVTCILAGNVIFANGAGENPDYNLLSEKDLSLLEPIKGKKFKTQSVLTGQIYQIILEEDFFFYIDTGKDDVRLFYTGYITGKDQKLYLIFNEEGACFPDYSELFNIKENSFYLNIGSENLKFEKFIAKYESQSLDFNGFAEEIYDLQLDFNDNVINRTHERSVALDPNSFKRHGLLALEIENDEILLKVILGKEKIFIVVGHLMTFDGNKGLICFNDTFDLFKVCAEFYISEDLFDIRFEYDLKKPTYKELFIYKKKIVNEEVDGKGKKRILFKRNKGYDKILKKYQ